MSDAPSISIVDDDELARDGIPQLVESLGYNAFTFTSAEHFLQSAVVAQTTCLITDLQMPGLSGLDLQQELQSRGYHTPVILITAYPDDKHRTRALNNGAVGFLSKPFDDRSLMPDRRDRVASQEWPRLPQEVNSHLQTFFFRTARPNRPFKKLTLYGARQLLGTRNQSKIFKHQLQSASDGKPIAL